MKPIYHRIVETMVIKIFKNMNKKSSVSIDLFHVKPFHTFSNLL